MKTKELLKSFNGSIIYCLIRNCATEEEAKTKIINNFKYYLLPVDSIDLNRIKPIIGDLSKVKWGLSDSMFDQLCEAVDCIFHNGCYVNGIFPYLTLKGPNVIGTLEAIRLASTKKRKFLFYISSLSAVTGVGRLIKEDEPLSLDPLPFYPGYG